MRGGNKAGLFSVCSALLSFPPSFNAKPGTALHIALVEPGCSGGTWIWSRSKHGVGWALE